MLGHHKSHFAYLPNNNTRLSYIGPLCSIQVILCLEKCVFPNSFLIGKQKQQVGGAAVCL